jgi:hypothetical protein
MSNLLKMSLALEDDNLNKRVHAASILRAQQLKNRDDAQGDFARLILSNTSRRWEDFIIRVASDAEVQDAIALSPDNTGIYATNVTDKQIQDLVASELTHTARRITPRQPEPEAGE